MYIVHIVRSLYYYQTHSVVSINVIITRHDNIGLRKGKKEKRKKRKKLQREPKWGNTWVSKDFNKVGFTAEIEEESSLRDNGLLKHV